MVRRPEDDAANLPTVYDELAELSARAPNPGQPRANDLNIEESDNLERLGSYNAYRPRAYRGPGLTPAKPGAKNRKSAR